MQTLIKNLDQLVEAAIKGKTKTLVVAAAEDKYVLNAIAKAREAGLIHPIFIGDKEKIKEIALETGVGISNQDIIHANSESEACMRAVKMIAEGKADLLMKGLVPTGTLLKHVVSKEYGLLSGKLLSHLALFESPYYHKILGLTDAAMNIAPTLEEKAAILENAISAFHALGYEQPKVAILAAVEKVNPKMPATTEAAILKTMAERNQSGSCQADGPMALDNAISKEAAEHKEIHSPVAGDADLLLAPDLNSGNILYKALSFLGNARCAAIIVGSKSPIVLTSRADTEETKFLSIALAVLTSK